MQFLQPAAPRIHSAHCQYTLTSQSCLKLTLLLFCHIYIKTQLEFFSLSLCSSWLTNEVKKLQLKYLSFFFSCDISHHLSFASPIGHFPPTSAAKSDAFCHLSFTWELCFVFWVCTHSWWWESLTFKEAGQASGWGPGGDFPWDWVLHNVCATSVHTHGTVAC